MGDVFWQWVFDHLRSEWEMITRTPLLFAVAAFVAGIIAFYAARWNFSDRIESKDTQIQTKEAHIAFIERQLEEYKSKLSGATPEEAQAQIAELRDEVKTTRAEIKALLEWHAYQTEDRRLTADQAKILAEGLTGLPSEHLARIMVTSIHEPEPQQYSLDIHKCFIDAKTPVHHDNQWGMQSTSPDEVGVLVVVKDQKNPPEYAVQIFNALKAADVDVSWDCFDGWSDSECCVWVSYKRPMKTRI